MAKGGGKEAWGTRLGVILAVMGSAVGLGNFLRFPGQAAQYEGGAFMIPYFIALFVIGFPLAWAEWAMGRYGGARGFNSTPGIYRSIWKNKAAPYFGIVSLLIPVVIYMYYVLIESWCLAYAWYYLNGTMAELGKAATTTDVIDKDIYNDFFNGAVGAGADGAAFTGQGAGMLGFLLLCFTLNFAMIYRGLSKGIEKFCLWAMPLLILCAIVVLIRVLTLDNIDAGLGFMWNLRFEGAGIMKSLANPDMWLAATAQVFFTLSIGFGIIITYASYLKPKDDVALGSLTSCAGNEFCEVALGGMIIIPAAFIFLGADTVTEAADSSFNLGFRTLPMVFELMPLGYVAGFLFFFLLFLAALTSSLSMLQPAIALLQEGLGMGRKTAVAILGFIALMGALFVLYFSKDTVALDTFDFWVGSVLIFLLALFQVVLFGWVLGLEKGMAEIDRGAAIRVPRMVGFLLKYVSPVYMIVLFVMWVYDNVGKQVAAVRDNMVVAMSIGFIALVAILFALLIAESVRRWNRADAEAARASAEGSP